MTKSDRVQAIIGSIIIGCSVAAFFWWGMHFAVFDSDIDWLGRPEQVALPILIVVAAFGAGYAIGGKNFGVRASSGTALVFVAAAAVGAIRTAI